MLKTLQQHIFSLDFCDLSFVKFVVLLYYLFLCRWRRRQNRICSNSRKLISSCFGTSHEEQPVHTYFWRTVGHTGAVLWAFSRKSGDTGPRDFPQWIGCGETCCSEVPINNITHMQAHTHTHKHTDLSPIPGDQRTFGICAGIDRQSHTHPRINGGRLITLTAFSVKVQNI